MRQAIQPTDDPLPWITSVMRKQGVFITHIEREQYGDWEQVTDQFGSPVWRRPSRETRRMTGAAASGLLTVLTQAVSALHDDAKAYTVVLSASAATAGTLLEKKVVQVGSKPMNDETLTDGQKAAVMAGLALHEVGHIRYARQNGAAVTRLFGADKVTGAIRTISNLAADMHDEALACEVFPGLAPAVAVTLWWVGNKGQLDGRDVDEMLVTSAIARVNAAILATRYPWQVEWDTTAAKDWLDWWTEWGERATKVERPKEHAEIVQEGIEKIRDFEPEPQDPPPGPVCGPMGPRRKAEQEGPDASDEPKGKGDGKDDPDGEGKGSEPKPDAPKGEGKGKGEGETPDTKPGSGSNESGDEPTTDGEGKKDIDGGSYDPGEDVKPEPGDIDDGKPAESVDGGEGKSPPSTMGSMTGDGTPYDPDEDRVRADDACVKPAAAAGYDDEHLQRSADKVTRGKREGMRRRHYNHPSSRSAGYGGRTVVSIPRKGKRFVWDV